MALLAAPLLNTLVPADLPLSAAPALDLRVLLFAALVTTVTGVGFGVLPALRIARRRDFRALRDGQRSGGDRRQRRLRSAFVLAEVAASVVLVVSAGSLIRALARVQAIDPGFRTENVLAIRTPLPFPRYESTAALAVALAAIGLHGLLSFAIAQRTPELALLDEELQREGAKGELHVVGGAVMCLVLDARAATRDVDAFFKPTGLIRRAAARVAARPGLPEGWLNDAVKGFLSPRGNYSAYLELPNLRVYVAEPNYLLAMKCAAMRLGEEFHDLEDVSYLLRHLNITTTDEALAVVSRYFEDEQLHPKTRLALEELLPQQV